MSDMTALKQKVAFTEQMSAVLQSILIAHPADLNQLTVFGISNELRYFADRSLYDAMATIFLRNGIPTKRSQRNYSLDSVSAYSEGSPYTYCPDVGVVPKLKEDGIACLHKIAGDRWAVIYTGIRDSYLMVTKDGIVDLYVDITTDLAGQKVEISMYGNERAHNDLQELFSQNLHPMNDRKAERLQLNGDGSISNVTIRLKDPERYGQGIYPNVPYTPESLYNGFMASGSRCLVFYGPAGCGKSSFTSMMIALRGYDKLIFVDDNQLYENPTLINTIREAEDGSLIVFEDADNLLRKREEGNKQMSALLNVISGVAERDIHMVFLTNLKTENDIDEALLRPGRTFKSIKFGFIEKDMVNKVRENLKLTPLDATVVADKSTWTLADIVHYGEGSVAQGIGFR